MEQHLEPGHRAGGSGTSDLEKMPGPPNGVDGRTSRLVIAGDPGFGDEYLARVVDARAHGHDPAPDPIVEIVRLLKYPAQRAIAPPHAAHEAPPLPAGCICRLPILRTAPDTVPDQDPLDAAIREARTEAEREILLRHREGVIRGRRAVMTYSRADLEWLRRLK